MHSYIREYDEDDKKVPKDIDEILNNIAFFSLIWSVGGALDENTRKQLNDVAYSLIQVHT